MNINGKTALITGGAHRIGRAITLELASKGANVIINYHNSENMAEQTVTEANKYNVKAMAIQADVSNTNAVNNMFTKSQNELGPVQILINSASIFKKTPLPLNTTHNWDEVTNTLIKGAFNCANEASKHMLSTGSGNIINIVDIMAWIPRSGYAAHAVGKSALMGMTRQLAVDLAPHVRVNAVAPGPVLAPNDYSQETKDKIASRTLLKRWGKPEDVSKAVSFLIESDYITGEYITVDGGERYGK